MDSYSSEEEDEENTLVRLLPPLDSSYSLSDDGEDSKNNTNRTSLDENSLHVDSDDSVVEVTSITKLTSSVADGQLVNTKQEKSGQLDADVIINLLLQKPEEHEFVGRPSGIRENRVFTLDCRRVSIEAAKVDNNGAYRAAGGANSRFFRVLLGEDGSVTHCDRVHETGLNSFELKGQKTEVVEASDVYELKRSYRKSKLNDFSQMIATLRRADCKQVQNYFLVAYRWCDGIDHSPNDFIVDRHGNARNPHASTYYRQDQSMMNKGRRLIDQGASISATYSQLVGDAQDVREDPRNLQAVKNLKKSLKKPTVQAGAKEAEASSLSECEALVRQVRDNPYFARALTLLPDHYTSFNATQQMIVDLGRFCVHGQSVLMVDTTFELVEGLWLTDTCYQHEGLLNENNEHPYFPGPMMWHFKKTTEFYRRFALEIAFADPQLLGIKKVGHDLDDAIRKGLGDIFQSASHLYCTQHIQNADVRKLKDRNANQRTISHIMADIYGAQDGPCLYEGLADAEDGEDFDVKLESLQESWESLIPGFHQWWKVRRSDIFKSNLVLSARVQHGIKGRFYTNNLELAHKLQKKFLSDAGSTSRSVAVVNEYLQQWVQEFHSEALRAIRGVGKYRLASGYLKFFVDPVEWNRWNEARKENHVHAFMAYIPSEYGKYNKPLSAGLKKAPDQKRRARQEEPELFVSSARFSSGADDKKVTPVKLARINDDWSVANTNLDLLNPQRQLGKSYVLVHRKDTANCPAKVQRCESCRRAFTDQNDIVIVKTEGLRQYTDKSGNRRKNTGNVYLHYLGSCLRDYDQQFKFSSVKVLRATLALLPGDGARRAFEKAGLQFE